MSLMNRCVLEADGGKAEEIQLQSHISDILVSILQATKHFNGNLINTNPRMCVVKPCKKCLPKQNEFCTKYMQGLIIRTAGWPVTSVNDARDSWLNYPDRTTVLIGPLLRRHESLPFARINPHQWKYSSARIEIWSVWILHWALSHVLHSNTHIFLVSFTLTASYH